MSMDITTRMIPIIGEEVIEEPSLPSASASASTRSINNKREKDRASPSFQLHGRTTPTTFSCMAETSGQRVAQVPELLDLICAAVIGFDVQANSGAVSEFRLVSRAFLQASTPYFALEVHSINVRGDIWGCYRFSNDDDSDQIREVGPYIHTIALDADNKDAISLAAKHCTNIREVTLVYLEMPGCSVLQGDYSEALAAWDKLPHRPLKTVNAIMQLEDGEGYPRFHEFDCDRYYFKHITELAVECYNPNEHHTVEVRDTCEQPLKWIRFLSFLSFFSQLKSLQLTGFDVNWSAMPGRVMCPVKMEPMQFRSVTHLDLGLGKIPVSAVFRLNRLCPNLTSLEFTDAVESDTFDSSYGEDEKLENSDDPDWGMESTDEEQDDKEQQETSPTDSKTPSENKKKKETRKQLNKLCPIFDNSYSKHVKTPLTLQRLVVSTSTDISTLADFVCKWAPELKVMICYSVYLKDELELKTALGSLNDRLWNWLHLGSHGKWTGLEFQTMLKTTELVKTAEVQNMA
ncbi:hypothetical protein BG004_003050 [Podila humilis]|nr:hypothetical protein BG004_003050 [Podila humilis]